jgi:hypothetical protein
MKSLIGCNIIHEGILDNRRMGGDTGSNCGGGGVGGGEMKDRPPLEEY